MKNLQLLFLLLLVGITFSACKSKQQAQAAPQAQSQLFDQLNADQQKLILDFKGDPYGCQKVRDAMNSSEVAAIFHEHKAGMADVEAMIGKPETEDQSEGKIVWGYYFDGTCQNGKLKPGTVYCLLQLYFDAQSKAWALGSVVCG